MIDITQTVYETVRSSVVPGALVGIEKITDNLNLRKDLSMDSYEITCALFSLETQLEISFIGEPEDVNTVADIIRITTDAYNRKQKVNQPSQTEACTPKQDLKQQKIDFNQVTLYNIKNEKTYCKITGRQCKKLGTPTEIVACKQAKCKIANNFYKIVSEAQKTK